MRLGAGSLDIGTAIAVAEGTIVLDNPAGYRGVRIDGRIYDVGTGTFERVFADSDFRSFPTASAVHLQILSGTVATETIGLCLNPFYWSTGMSTPYTVYALAGGAQWPASVGVEEARAIGRLWQRFYRPIEPGMTAGAAAEQVDWNAGLQILIWQLVAAGVDPGAPDYFKVYQYRDGDEWVAAAGRVPLSAAPGGGAGWRDTHVTEMAQWLAGEGRGAPEAKLVALRCDSRAGQDYVVAVAEGGATGWLLLWTVAGGWAVGRRRGRW